MGVNSWALMEESFAMDGIMPPLWAYPDPIEELQQKLQHTTEEFNNFQLYANEKIKKQREDIDHLIQIIQEKEEANNQIHLLLKKLMSPSPLQHYPVANNCLQPESPQIRHTKNTSSITESDSISDTRNHQSYVSSPVESFFDAVTSPDLSHINMADSSQMAAPIAGGVQNYDQAYARIFEQLAMKKPLPEKGKLVASIMEAGPLLQTLLIAGPLPQWRNPPKLMQPITIPPIPIKGTISKSPNQSAAMLSHRFLLQNSSSGSYRENSQGVPQMHPTNVDLSAKRQRTLS